MPREPRTWKLSSLHRKRYREWAGDPDGRPADPARCCETVSSNERGSIPRQCERRRGFGPELAYCKTHDPATVAARRRKADERFQAQMDKQAIPWAAHKLFAALCKIADGDNDPRATAQKAIKGLKRPEGFNDETEKDDADT